VTTFLVYVTFFVAYYALFIDPNQFANATNIPIHHHGTSSSTAERTSDYTFTSRFSNFDTFRAL
jgi:putative alpha-1,2-mannosidase